MWQNFIADFTTPFPTTPWETALARLLVAAMLGGLVGWERETHEKPAGLRTHMLIALAACLFTLLGLVSSTTRSRLITSAPTRCA